jgi:hypothetical protein
VRRAALVLAAASVGAVALLSAGPGAADTGVSGTVDSVVELTLRRTAPDTVAATVSATVAPTALRATQAGEGTRAIKTYDTPVAGTRTSVRAAGTDDAPELTITYGPAGP